MPESTSLKELFELFPTFWLLLEIEDLIMTMST
jgi:hypothetical protein